MQSAKFLRKKTSTLQDWRTSAEASRNWLVRTNNNCEKNPQGTLIPNYMWTESGAKGHPKSESKPLIELIKISSAGAAHSRGENVI